MKRRELLSGLAAATLASGCTSQAPSRVHTSEAHYGSPRPVALAGHHRHDLPGESHREAPVLACLPARSAADGHHRPAAVGRAGVTSPDGKRAAPSAGALYPLELYVVTPEQVMHYASGSPSLRCAPGPLRCPPA